jgi:multiple sugar transport system substrate-binding protein
MAEITRLPDNFDWFLNRFAGYGGIYFDANMQPQLDTPAGVSALNNFIQAIKYGPPGILNFEYPESFAAYLQGQTAMCIQWTDVAKSAEDPNSSKVVGMTGYAQIPGVKQSDGSVIHRSTLAYSRVNAVSNLSKNQEAAYRVIQFMAQPDVALSYTTEPHAGIDPFLQSTYADPTKWVEQWPTINDYVANNKQSIVNGYPELTIPGAFRYDQALGQHIANALAGQESTEAALQGATADWNKITDDLGRDTQKGFWQQQLQDWKTVGLIK